MSSNSNYVQLKNYDFQRGCPNENTYLAYDRYQNYLNQKNKNIKEDYISLSASVRYPWSNCCGDPDCNIMGVS
tara:strand:- start:247 stop:465 length:219 start_codon:yes stop_codon:yes gene_type:complete